MNTTERLTAHMEEVDDAQPHGAGVEAVMDAGNRYRRRRITTISGLGVAAVFVLAFAANAIQSAIADGPADSDVVSEGRNEISESSDGRVDWTAFESPVKYNNGLAVDGSTVYVLTTAPGTKGMQPHEAPQAIFATADGESWTHEIVDLGLRLGRLVADDGVIYAIGTAPGVTAMNGDASFHVLASDDGGITWNDSEIPLAAAPPDTVASRTVWTQMSVAAHQGTVLAMANTSFDIDVSQFVPAEFRGDSFEARPTADGVEVIDWRVAIECRTVEHSGAAAGVREECIEEADDEGDELLPETQDNPVLEDVGDGQTVVFRATWDELDVEPFTSRYVELFVSAAGGEFEAVQAPFGAADIASLVGVEDGFVLYTVGHSAQVGVTVWFSADGRTWDPLGAVPDMAYVSQVGSVGGKLVVAGQRSGFGQDGGYALAVWDDGGWAEIDIPVGADIGGAQMQQAAFSEHGALVMIQPIDPMREDGGGSSIVLFSSDLETWVDASVSDILGPLQGGAGDLAITDHQIHARIDFWEGPNQPTLWASSPRP